MSSSEHNITRFHFCIVNDDDGGGALQAIEIRRTCNIRNDVQSELVNNNEINLWHSIHGTHINFNLFVLVLSPDTNMNFVWIQSLTHGLVNYANAHSAQCTHRCHITFRIIIVIVKAFALAVLSLSTFYSFTFQYVLLCTTGSV